MMDHLLSNCTRRVSRVEFCKGFYVFKGFVIHTVWQYIGKTTYKRMDQSTHAVSGASLSLFSKRYFTSEISKQPALLNSVRQCDEYSPGGHDDSSSTGPKFQRRRIFFLILWSVPQPCSHCSRPRSGIPIFVYDL